MPICGNAPFLHTAYMQSTVLSFSCSGGWGLQSGELKVELADAPAGEQAQRGRDSLGAPDTNCWGFNPGPIGSPTVFEYNGFYFTGLIKGWEEDVSISGRKYTVTIESPHVVLDNTQLVLKYLDDFDPTVFYGGGPRGKFINVHQEVAPRPFQGMTYFSYCNKVGCSWGDIYMILHNNWRFTHKGFTYVLDLSHLGPLLGPGPFLYKFSGENFSVLQAIEQFATAQCRRVRLELWPAGTAGALPGNHTIKVRADNIAVQPPPAILMNQPSTTGAIRTRLAAGGGWKLLSVQSTSSCNFSGGINDIVQSQKYGLESCQEISDALIVGDNMRMMYEVTNTAKECGGAISIATNPNSPLGAGIGDIRHYWGEQADSRGNMVPIVSTGCGDDELFYVDVSAQSFFRTIQGITIPFTSCLTNNRYLPITVLEIRAAGNSFESWFEYMCEYKMSCLIEFFSPSLQNFDFSRFDLDVLMDILQADATLEERSFNPDDAVRTNEEAAAIAEQMHRDRRDAHGVEGLRQLHSFVKKFTAFYGQQFAVSLPAGLITCCNAGTNPSLVAGLERSEFGWAWNDGSFGGGMGAEDTVLGLPWSSVPLEIFKNDDGACKPILYYECIQFEPDNEGARGASRAVGIDFAKITVPFFVQPCGACDEEGGGALGGITTVDSASSAGLQGSQGTVSRAYMKPGWETVFSSPLVEKKRDYTHHQALDYRRAEAEAAPNRTEAEFNPGYKLWLQCNVKKIHDPCNLIGNGPVAVMATPSPIFLRPVDVAGNKTGNANALWDILIANRLGRELDEAEKDRLNSLLGIPGGQGLRGMGLIPKAHMPAAAAVTFKDNSRTYPSVPFGAKFFDQTTADSKAYFERNEALSPWKTGGLSILNNSGAVLVQSITSAQEVIEAGSISYAGTPSQANISGLGAAIGGGGTEVQALTLSVGMQGVTTTAAFRTYMTNFGELGKNEQERLASIGRSNLRTQRANNLRIAEELMEHIRQVFMDVDGDDSSEASGLGAGDSSTAGPGGLTLGYFNNANESDFILGFGWAASQHESDLDKVSGVGNYSAFEPLRAALTAMGADDSGRADMAQRAREWRIRGGMSLEGLIRPYQFVDEFGDLKNSNSEVGKYGKINPVMPPYRLVKSQEVGFFPDTGWCAEESYGKGYWPDWGINNYTLNPFLAGHDIRRGIFEGEYPDDGIEFYEKTGPGRNKGRKDSTSGGAGPTQIKHIRPYALKGPMVMAGWGYDIDGYPVPNYSQKDDLSPYKPEERVFQFMDDFLTRQDQWKAGPIDLRWDEVRGVWAPKPANKFKIIPFKIIGEWVYEATQSNWQEGEETSTYDPKTGGYIQAKKAGKGYKVYSALASSEPACTSDVCCIGPIVESGSGSTSDVCGDDEYSNTSHSDFIDPDKDGKHNWSYDFLSDWTGYPEKYAPCDAVPAEEFCANNDYVTFKVYDVLDLYAGFGEGDVGFAYRDFDCASAFIIIEMGYAGGDRCMIRETTEFIDNEDTDCDLLWRIGKTSYQLNMGDPDADADRKDEQTQAPVGTEGCMPCTLEETYWVDSEGFATMLANDQCEVISENARYDFNFDVHKKQYLCHVPTGGATSYDDDGNPLDEDGEPVDFDSKKGPCIKWCDSPDDCLIPELPKIVSTELTLGQRGVAPGFGGMACSLEDTYKFTEDADAGEDFEGWTVVEPVSENARYNHNFNPNKEQVLTHKKIAWKRVIGGIDGQGDDLAPEGPIVWWDDMGGCAIPEESSPVDLEDGEGLHVGEFKHIEFGLDVQFPCNLEKTYWMQPDNYPTRTRNNWNSDEQVEFFDNYNVATSDDAANGDLYEVSENLRDSSGRGRKAEFNPIWRQVLGHTHTKFPLATTGPSFQQDFAQVAWAPEWYATIPSKTLKQGDNGVDRLMELYYVMDEAAGTGQYGAVPGVRPDYDINHDTSLHRFGQEVFPETLWQTYQHVLTDVDKHSTYLGEGNNYWGFTRKNKYNFDPNKLQVFAHYAAATEDEDNQVTSIDDATTSTPSSGSDDFEENNGPFIKWLDYSGCTLPKETEEGPDLDHPWIFGQDCLPCRFEQTLGYAVADNMGDKNGGYNDPYVNPAVKDFGFDPNKKQYLGHVQEGGEDFIESGDDSDFDSSEGPCVEWFDSGEGCDIIEEGKMKPEDPEDPDSDEIWRFGKDFFPCTLEETYKTTGHLGTGLNSAWPLPEPHGKSDGLGIADNWWTDDQNETISKWAVNDFNFRPDIVQFLGHIPNLGEECDENNTPYGPQIKWMQPYLLGVPYSSMPRSQFDPCSSVEDIMWGQDDLPPTLEITYMGTTNTNANNETLTDVDDGPPSRHHVDRRTTYNFNSADFQVLGHPPGGGYNSLESSGNTVKGGENEAVGPGIKWDYGPWQVVDIGGQRSQFPCTLQDTLYGSSAQFTSNFADDLQDFNYDIDKEQVLCHNAQSSSSEGDDKVYWESLDNMKSKCKIPEDSADAASQGAPSDQYSFPCTLEQTYGGSIIEPFSDALTSPNDFDWSDTQRQVLMHFGDGDSRGRGGVPNVAWVDVCQIAEGGAAGGVKGTNFFPCHLYDTYYDPGGGPSVQGNGAFNYSGDFGFDETKRQVFGHNFLGQSAAGTGDAYWQPYPQVPYAALGFNGSADFPLFMSDMYGGAPVFYTAGGRVNNDQNQRGGQRPEQIASNQDRLNEGVTDKNWDPTRFQALAHISDKQTVESGGAARIPSIEWVDMTLCEIDPRDGGTPKKFGTTCLPCFLQDTYKGAGAYWIDDNVDANGSREANLNSFSFDPTVEQVLMHDKASGGNGPCVKWGPAEGSCSIQDEDQACHPCTLEDTYYGSGVEDAQGNEVGIGPDSEPPVTGFQYDPEKIQTLAHFKGGHGGSDKDCVSWMTYYTIDPARPSVDNDTAQFPSYFWQLLKEAPINWDKSDYDFSADAQSYGYDSAEVQVLGHTKTGDSGTEVEEIQWMTVKDCDDAEAETSPSDERLKRDIKLVGKSPSGINIYEFTFNEKIHDNFKGYSGLKFRGALYQELKKTHPDCVKRDQYSGYGMIMYDKIDVDFVEVE